MEMTLEHFSSKFLLSAEKETSLLDIKKMMEEVSVRHIPIVHKEKPVGIISDRDLKFFANHSLLEKYCAADVMTPDPYSVPKHTPIKEVIDTMVTKKYGSILLLDSEEKICGIFTTTDALIAFKTFLKKASVVV